MKDESWQKTRWHNQQFGVFGASKSLPKHWRSGDIKSFLPSRAVQCLAIAIQNLPVRGPCPEIDEEGWWADILGDPRLRRSKQERLPADHRDACLRLDRCSATGAVTFTCASCKRSATLNVADLCKSFGTDRNVSTLGRYIIHCDDKRKRREGYDCDVRHQV
jgi:hypothetical protein